MEIFLGNENYFVDGIKNAAIYDLKNEKIYELNEAGKEALIKLEQKKELNNLEKDFINKLISKKIIVPKLVSKDFKLPQPKYKIDFAWLELTDKCNLRCIHCYGNFGYEENTKTCELKKEEWFDIINQLYDMGCRHIQLIGGEPFCNKDFEEIIEYLNKKGFKRITVFTNATLINEKNVKKLKKYNVNIRFSLYGHNKETHDKITNVKGSFEKTISAINLLRENEVQVSVAIILMKENEQFLEKIKKMIVNDLKLRYNGYDVIRPSCVNDNLEHRINSYEILRGRYYTKPSFRITRESFYKNHYYNPCWNSKIAITSTGDIIPCIFARKFIIGNIKKGKIENFKENILQQWQITKNKIKQCQNCEYRYACSDCRPLAIGIYEEDDAKYPRCCYSPEKGIWEKIEDVTQEIIK